jgi:hypothetical protein
MLVHTLTPTNRSEAVRLARSGVRLRIRIRDACYLLVESGWHAFHLRVPLVTRVGFGLQGMPGAPQMMGGYPQGMPPPMGMHTVPAGSAPVGMPGPPAASGASAAAAPAAAAAAAQYGIPAGSDWTGHKAPDGRTYFYNTKTKQSSWTKPKELMTQLELADSQTPWKVRV